MKHDQVAAGYDRCEVTHPVEVRAGTLLGNLVGSGAVGVNSMHHQAVRALGMHLIPTARASDGVVEAVEAPAVEAADSSAQPRCLRACLWPMRSP